MYCAPVGIVTVAGRPTPPPPPLGCKLSSRAGTFRPAAPEPSAEFVMMPAYAVAAGASRIAAAGLVASAALIGVCCDWTVCNSGYLFRWHGTCEMFVAEIITWLIGSRSGWIVSFSWSVEQSRGPPGPTPVGFGGCEDDADPAVDGLAPPSAVPDEEDAAAAVVAAVLEAPDEIEGALAAVEDFELPQPAARDPAASATATAAPSRMPIGRLASEVFISSSMPCGPHDARGNPTTFTTLSPPRSGDRGAGRCLPGPGPLSGRGSGGFGGSAYGGSMTTKWGITTLIVGSYLIALGIAGINANSGGVVALFAVVLVVGFVIAGWSAALPWDGGAHKARSAHDAPGPVPTP